MRDRYEKYEIVTTLSLVGLKIKLLAKFLLLNTFNCKYSEISQTCHDLISQVELEHVAHLALKPAPDSSIFPQ